MEAAVGAERIAFAREHARRILVLALEGEHAGGERKETGEGLSHPPFQNLAVILESGERDFRQPGSRKGNRVEPGVDFLFAHLDHVLVARVGPLRLGPLLDELPGTRVEPRVFLRDQRIQHDRVLARRGEHRFRRKQLLPLARYSRLLAGAGVVAAHRVRDLGKVAAARRRDDRVSRGGGARPDRGKRARSYFQAVLDERGQDTLVERGNAVVVEARSDRAVYRHGLGGAVEELSGSLGLLPHVAQRTAGFPPRRIDRENGDAEPVFLVEPEAAHQLIGERGFSRASCTGYAKRRYGKRMGLLQHLPAQFFGGAELKGGDESRQRPAVTGLYGLEVLRRVLRQVLVAALEHVVDHALQAHLLTVLGRVNARDAVGLKLADLVCDDHAAAAAEHLDVLPAAAAQQVDHVREVLDVAALVRGDRDALHVFLQRGRNDFVDRAVVAEMDHFRPARLQDAALVDEG